MKDQDQIRAATFLPLFRRFIDEAAKAGSDIRRIVLDEDGKLTADGMDYAQAGVLPELFKAAYWVGRESEALAFYEQLAAAVPEHLRDDVLPAIDLTDLRRGAARGGIERFVRR